MTNAEIIVSNMMTLVAEGVITQDNIIDTVPGWNRRGYKIKRGEEHVAAFPIWRPRTKKKGQTDDEAVEEEVKKGRFYLKTAYWFTNQQVEPMEKEESK